MRPTRWQECLRYSPSGLPSGLRFLQNHYRSHSMLLRKSYASSQRLCCLSGGWTEKSPNLESDGLELSRLRPDTTKWVEGTRPQLAEQTAGQRSTADHGPSDRVGSVGW